MGTTSLRVIRAARGSAIALLACAACMSAGTGVASADLSGGASASGEIALQRGDRGEAVEQVQTALGVEPVDGVFGPATERAVKDFQEARGLAPDGVVGPLTRAALGLEPFSSSAVRRTTRVPLMLRLIARCESGGDPTAVSSGGRYRGKYQFSRPTWRSLGGTGDPAAAPEWLQDRLALKLYRARGTAPWPHCSKKARAQARRAPR
jgi:Transglycosylase-like domain/Putative peptidoglycan binding domain